MDKYNHWLGKFLKKINHAKDYAITLGQTVYYSESKEYVMARPRWIKHENCHKKQWKEEGLFKFAIKYMWYNLTKGYEKNPYEIEARAASLKD